MSQDLSGYLNELRDKHPGQVIEVKEDIDPSQHEISAYIKLLEDKGKYPVILFQRVKNLQGGLSQFPLVHNLFATRSFCATAIGLDSSDHGMGLVSRFGEMQDNPVDYEVVEPGQAPVMENVLTGASADITMLPAARYHEKDAGPYFVMACIMKGASGNYYDVSLTKNMVKGPRRMTLSAGGHQHLGRMAAEYESMGKRAPVAIVLGYHPAFYLGSCALTPYQNDDYRTIGGYLGHPLRLVPSASLGDDFLVPADAEIIIEGFVPPGVMELQNPFGEVSGHYQPEKKFPVIEVEAICFRNNAIMEGMLPAHSEHFNLGGIPKEGSVFNAIKRVVPGVRTFYLPHSGCSRFSSYISLKKNSYRDVQIAAMIAFSEIPTLKLAVVVDEDIDVFNEAEVIWAVITQSHWDKDLTVIPRVQSIRNWLGNAVMIIDATHPEGISDFPGKNKIPEETIRRIKSRFNNLQ